MMIITFNITINMSYEWVFKLRLEMFRLEASLLITGFILEYGCLHKIMPTKQFFNHEKKMFHVGSFLSDSVDRHFLLNWPILNALVDVLKKVIGCVL